MSFTNFLAAELLDHLFTRGAYTAPTNIYVALSSTTPAEDGTGITEPSGNGYTRVTTDSNDWSNASVTDPSVLDNSATVTFPQATGGDWDSGNNMTHFVLFDHITNATNVLAFGALTTAKPVLSGDTAEFAATDLTITLD